MRAVLFREKKTFQHYFTIARVVTFGDSWETAASKNLTAGRIEIRFETNRLQ